MARPKKQLADAEAVKMRDVEAYTHDDKKRTNNPPVGMAQHDKAEEKVKTYQFDPHLDPTLQWAGKAEGMSFDVLLPLYIFMSPSSPIALLRGS